MPGEAPRVLLQPMDMVKEKEIESRERGAESAKEYERVRSSVEAHGRRASARSPYGERVYNAMLY